MSDKATGKGALLTAGIAALSAGTAVLLTPNWWVGIILLGVGTGLIFIREYLKEN